jgi:hypothetical protein
VGADGINSATNDETFGAAFNETMISGEIKALPPSALTPALSRRERE